MGTGQHHTINTKVFLHMCTELKLIGPLFSFKLAHRLFAFCQQEEDRLSAEKPFLDDVFECSWLEFQELITAVAGVIYPNPHTDLASKIESLMHERVLREARNLSQFKMKRALFFTEPPSR